MSKETPFQTRVYQALMLVPSGYVTTYKLLAEFVGTKAYRAVGTALKNNPYAPALACHRVIASDLSIGGFAGQRKGPEIERKKALLLAEGVRFVNNKLQDKERLFYFDLH